MAELTEVPTFVKGEPGFAAKLNTLATAIAELQVGLKALEAAAIAAVTPVAEEVAKATVRRKATAKAE